MIDFSFIFVSQVLCKNTLSKITGFHNSSNITILQPALYPGSIANIFLPYSGLVISKLARFCLNVSIASSSQTSDKIHLSSFSTEVNKASYQSLNASSNNAIKGKLTL
jgi:hypothetical protein